jgi:hypothetical protein
MASGGRAQGRKAFKTASVIAVDAHADIGLHACAPAPSGRPACSLRNVKKFAFGAP